MKKRMLLILPIIFILFIATGCTEIEEFENIVEDEINSNNLSLTESKGYADEYGFSYYVEGIIKNNGTNDYDYVQVTFTTYDKDGNTIGSCLDNNSGLSGNGTWKFKAICSGEATEITTYELEELLAS